MPHKSAWIVSSGWVKRKANTIYLETEEKSQSLPVKNLQEIFVFGEVKLNRSFFDFLSQNKILLHFFSYGGRYLGSFVPWGKAWNGEMIISQVKFYLNSEKRLFLAKSFVKGAILNTLFVLRVYQSRKIKLSESIKEIEKYLERAENACSVEELMAYEGYVKQVYYEAFNKILQSSDFSFDGRTRKPPQDPINALISFGNSLLYCTILSEIFKTRLDPRIGFLHASSERNFSLNLDIAEIFKPIIVDRVIFSLINRREIKKKDFFEKEGVFLNKNGLKKFLSAYEKRLETTLYVSRYKRKMSYKEIILEECYKLCRHFEGKEKYTPFVCTR